MESERWSSKRTADFAWSWPEAVSDSSEMRLPPSTWSPAGAVIGGPRAAEGASKSSTRVLRRLAITGMEAMLGLRLDLHADKDMPRSSAMPVVFGGKEKTPPVMPGLAWSSTAAQATDSTADGCRRPKPGSRIAGCRGCKRTNLSFVFFFLKLMTNHCGIL